MKGFEVSASSQITLAISARGSRDCLTLFKFNYKVMLAANE
jgi:hypothetical protein